MIELTVGYVAGFIALAVFIAQVWCLNAIVFILAGLLRDENNAVTWSVAARALQNSYWPDVLRVEAASNYAARKEIALVTSLLPFTSLLVAIVGVVTPLGLYDIFTSGDSVSTTFQYANDPSPYAYGTPPRSDFPFTRYCGYNSINGVPMNCPYSNNFINVTYDKFGVWETADMPWNYNLTIPQILLDIYSSGTKGRNTTIANYFDIQWRQYASHSSVALNNGSEFLAGAFRQMQSLVLADGIVPLEGLLVDAENGGIGFRNHTMPQNLKYGASWSEDILFIEPESVCINTNLTLDFSIQEYVNNSDPSNYYNTVAGLVLTDRGGFVNLNHTYPECDFSNSQSDPQLYCRAYKAAFMNNAWTMLYLNVTNPSNQTLGTHAFSYLNSSLGRTFPMLPFTRFSAYDSLGLTSTWADYLQLSQMPASNYTTSMTGFVTPPNPWHVIPANFSLINLLCSGGGNGDIANISYVKGSCGLMHAAPQRQSPGNNLLFDGGSKWSVPLYSCASVTKATIKTVDFRYNGSSDLNDLSVVGLRNKVYNNPADLPLWGVENTTMTMGEVNVIWGLVSDDFEGYPNVSTIRQESLYLPGWTLQGSGMDSIPSNQNLPGSNFFGLALESAYQIGLDSYISAPTIDYSGHSNMAILKAWQDLTSSSKNASKIMNLVWTDYAAAAVVGTKSILNLQNGVLTATYRVQPIVSTIKFHYWFGVPAFILCALSLLIGIGAVILWINGHSNLASIRRHLHQSSSGRIFTAFLYPEEVTMQTPSKQWIERVGKNNIDLSEEIPMMNKFELEERKIVAQKPSLNVEIQDSLLEGEHYEGDDSPKIMTTPKELRRRPVGQSNSSTHPVEHSGA